MKLSIVLVVGALICVWVMASVAAIAYAEENVDTAGLREEHQVYAAQQKEERRAWREDLKARMKEAIAEYKEEGLSREEIKENLSAFRDEAREYRESQREARHEYNQGLKEARGEAYFDRVDANEDGVIDPAERRLSRRRGGNGYGRRPTPQHGEAFQAAPQSGAGAMGDVCQACGRSFKQERFAKRRFDRDNNPPGEAGGSGSNWENPAGPRGGPGMSPNIRRPGFGNVANRRNPRFGQPRRPDRDNNPPGEAGGPGSNWENPAGPYGGPGMSPNIRRPGFGNAANRRNPRFGQPRRPDRDNNPPGEAGGPGSNWENPAGPRGGPGMSPDRHRVLAQRNSSGQRHDQGRHLGFRNGRGNNRGHGGGHAAGRRRKNNGTRKKGNGKGARRRR